MFLSSRKSDEEIAKKAYEKRVKKARKRSVDSWFEYLKFSNLQRELKGYGAEYSSKKYILLVFLSFLGVAVVGYYLNLEPLYLVICLAFFALNFPSMLLMFYKRQYEVVKFNDLVNYMEQMIYSTKRSPKILNALEDTRKLCEGEMAEAIDLAIDTIRTSDGRSGSIYKEALSFIEAKYACTRLYMLHDFLVRIEENGGKYMYSLDILLEDLRLWVETTYLLQKDRHALQGKITISIFLALGVSVLVTNMLPASVGDITTHPLYQISSVVLILCSIFTFVFAQKRVVRSWLKLEYNKDSQRIMRDYNIATSYNLEEANKKALIKAGIMFPLLILAVILGKPSLVFLVIGVMLVTFFFPRMKVKASRNSTIREIDKSFPVWLRGIALNLHVDNVYVSMLNSVDEAPVVLRAPLEKALDAMMDDPSDIRPYIEFLGEFDIPHIRSVFKMLYSLSEFGADDSDKQINTIIQRNSELVNKSEKMSNQDSLAIFGLLQLAPMLYASLKMIIDLGLFITQFSDYMDMSIF